MIDGTQRKYFSKMFFQRGRGQSGLLNQLILKLKFRSINSAKLHFVNRVEIIWTLFDYSKAAKIKDEEKLIKKINQTMLEMKKDGTIDRITKKYFK